jgi:2-polyprenyl-3-methyl-5-hydroxy-6-metoxy-1,4-benzoquinol methylase
MSESTNIIQEVINCPVCSSIKRKLMFTSSRNNIISKIYRCHACGLVYNGIKLRDKEESAYLSKNFLQNYSKIYKKQYAYALEYMKILKNKVKGEKMLDVGCGTGIFMEAAERIGFKTIGTEPFKPSVKIARQKKLKVVNKILSKTKFSKKKFDLILAIEVIEHFSNPVKEFRIMSRLLKKDGLIILQTSNQSSLTSLIKGKKRNYYYYDHLCYFSPKTLNYALDKVGLKIVKKYAGIVPYFKHLKSCSNFKEMLKISKIHFYRLFVFNKPILSSMTLFIRKKT